jgi:hypothetical protein
LPAAGTIYFRSFIKLVRNCLQTCKN